LVISPRILGQRRAFVLKAIFDGYVVELDVLHRRPSENVVREIPESPEAEGGQNGRSRDVHEGTAEVVVQAQPVKLEPVRWIRWRMNGSASSSSGGATQDQCPRD
jgi:hypothetical protein